MVAADEHLLQGDNLITEGFGRDRPFKLPLAKFDELPNQVLVDSSNHGNRRVEALSELVWLEVLVLNAFKNLAFDAKIVLIFDVQLDMGCLARLFDVSPELVFEYSDPAPHPVEGVVAELVHLVVFGVELSPRLDLADKNLEKQKQTLLVHLLVLISDDLGQRVEVVHEDKWNSERHDG